MCVCVLVLDIYRVLKCTFYLQNENIFGIWGHFGSSSRWGWSELTSQILFVKATNARLSMSDTKKTKLQFPFHPLKQPAAHVSDFKSPFRPSEKSSEDRANRRPGESERAEERGAICLRHNEVITPPERIQAETGSVVGGVGGEKMFQYPSMVVIRSRSGAAMSSSVYFYLWVRSGRILGKESVLVASSPPLISLCSSLCVCVCVYIYSTPAIPEQGLLKHHQC